MTRLAIIAILASTAAHAETTRLWPEGGASVTLRPSEAPGAIAEIAFANKLAAGFLKEAFDLSLGGFPVAVRMDHGPGDKPDTMTVTPPEGYIAVPPSVTVPEGETRVITIYSGEGGLS